ncbi:MAG TPA: SDR family oxidoreductase [Bryobacteraceae bacterium]|nr:SDR family oxidoreductase [Bryobacteraceae bacterium]
MKILVLGATGGTGREIVRQAAEHGHEVTAFVRTRDGLDALNGHITIVQGDLLNSSQLKGVLAGQDAVASGFGPRAPIAKADSHLLRTFANALTDAMSHAGVRRVIAVSVAFLFRDSIIPPAYLAGRLFFPNLVADASDMEHLFENSGLDWTIVRPPRLTDKPYTGAYRVREDHLPRFGFAISRADVADFVLKCAENHVSSRKIVGVCN